MKIKRTADFRAEVSTSSLNDIMFFLLLFFLIISTVTNPNVIKILLPKSKSGQTLNKQNISLTVTDDKRYYVNQHSVKFGELEPELLKACKGIAEPTIVLHLPRNLTVQDLVDVMQIGAKHKLKMVLATTTK